MGQPITVNVGPLAAADDDGAAASQAGIAAKPLVLNGALSNAVATAVAAAQAVAGAGNLTINGTFALGGVAYLGSPFQVYVTSAGNDSGITFTITGTAWGPNGTYAVVETITGANTGVSSTLKSFATVTQVAASGAATGNVSVGKQGTATFDQPRRLIITSAGDDSAKTFTVTGTSDGYSLISEVITGANAGVASSALVYKTVTSIIPSAATASTVIAGSNGVATSRWVRFDDYAGNAQVRLQATVSGTVNYSVQTTMQDPNDPTSPVNDESVVWIDSEDTGVVGATATKSSTFAIAPIFARVLLNSGTGTVSTVFRQVYTN